MRIIKESWLGDPDKVIVRYSALANEVGKMMADMGNKTALGAYVLGLCVDMHLSDKKAATPTNRAEALRGFKQGLIDE